MIGKSIFESFYQFHDVDRDGTKGMGIDIQRTIAALFVIKACPILWFMSRITSYNVCYTKLLRVKDPYCEIYFAKRDGVHLNIRGKDVYFRNNFV